MTATSIYRADVALTGRYTVSLASPTDDVSLTVLDGPGSGTVYFFGRSLAAGADSGG